MILSLRRPRALLTPARSVLLLSSLVALTAGASVIYFGQERSAPVAQLQDDRGWVGQLADVSDPSKTARADVALTSASLVVPKATLALPAMPAHASAPKPHTCGKQPCPVPQVGLPPITRQKASSDVVVAKAATKFEAPAPAKPNPLARVADVVRQPFGYASDTISGWIKRL